VGLNICCKWRLLASTVLSIILIAFQSSDATANADESSVPRPIKKIVSRYCNAVDDIAKHNALRMAVTPFMSTRQVTDDPNDFGIYIAEVITSQLITETKNIHLIERTRLDVITKENALTLSGLISESDARKVGELLPIDYILTGTYTVLGRELMINARLINAITGEISFSKSDQFEIPDDIKKMLTVIIASDQSTLPVTDSKASKMSMGDSCEQLQVKVFDKAGSAGPSNYNTVLIQEGMKIPFSRECSSVHQRIIDYCAKHQYNSVDYTSFLIRCSDTMNSSFGDPRGGAILRYFAADTLISPDEWKAALKIFSHIDYYQHISYVIRYEESISALQKERLTELFTLCAKQKIGRIPVKCTTLLNNTIDILDASYKNQFGTNDTRHDRSDLSRLLVLTSIFDIADPYLSDTASNVEAAILCREWEKYSDPAVKEKAFTALCKKLKSITVYREDDFNWFTDIAKKLCSNVFSDDAAVVTGKNDNFRLMSMLGESCSKMIQSVVDEKKLKQYNYEGLIPFCLYAGIEISGIPPLDSLKYWLAGEDHEKRTTACTYLMYMGKRAAPLESNIIRAIRKGIHTTPQPFFNQSLIDELGALKTNTPEVRELLVECLAKNDPGYIIDQPMIQAIAQCGPAIVPLVKKYYNEDKWNRLYETLQIMKLMGAGAKDLIPDIQSFAKTCDNPKYRLQAEDVIEEIRNKK
jgi:TolB-like protein